MEDQPGQEESFRGSKESQPGQEESFRGSEESAIAKMQQQHSETSTDSSGHFDALPSLRHDKTKSWFYEKVNKIDKLIARLTKKKRGRTQVNKIRSDKGEITTDPTETQNHKRIL